MIYIYNIIISFLCIIPIIMLLLNPKLILINQFKNHIKIFIIKLLFISMFIYFFLHNFNISNYTIFIISGVFNFTFFHLVEGLVSQKILNNNATKK